jgi:hypothetical protein
MPGSAAESCRQLVEAAYDRRGMVDGRFSGTIEPDPPQAGAPRGQRVEVIAVADGGGPIGGDGEVAAGAQEDLGLGLGDAALFGDDVHVETVVDAEAAQLGTLLGAGPVGDDAEAVTAQAFEASRDVGEWGPARLVVSEVSEGAIEEVSSD